MTAFASANGARDLKAVGAGRRDNHHAERKPAMSAPHRAFPTAFFEYQRGCGVAKSGEEKLIRNRHRRGGIRLNAMMMKVCEAAGRRARMTWSRGRFRVKDRKALTGIIEQRTNDERGGGATTAIRRSDSRPPAILK
jgi:hypothetical protein